MHTAILLESKNLDLQVSKLDTFGPIAREEEVLKVLKFNKMSRKNKKMFKKLLPELKLPVAVTYYWYTILQR